MLRQRDYLVKGKNASEGTSGYHTLNLPSLEIYF